MNEDRKPVSPHVGVHPVDVHGGAAGAGSVPGGALHESLPEAPHAITKRAIYPPMSTIDTGRLVAPVMSILANSGILAKLGVSDIGGTPAGAKPSTSPPHPQITEPLKAIALGFEMGFKQLASPTPYGNHISAYKIYRNKTANSFSGASLWETRHHDSALNQQAVTVQDSTASGGQNWYYFVTSVDSFGQESAPGSFQASAVTSLNANPSIHSATGSTSQPSTTSTSYSVVPEMTITLTTKGGNVQINFTCSIQVNQSTTQQGYFAIFKDGVQLTPDYIVQFAGAAGSVAMVMLGAISWLDAPSAGSHTYDVRWKVDTGFTLVARGTARSLQVVELG